MWEIIHEKRRQILNRKDKIQKIETKKHALVVLFISFLLIATLLGFIYFQGFAKTMVWQKQIDRIISYTQHNASLVHGMVYKDGVMEDNKDFFYDSYGDVFVVDEKGNVQYVIKSENQRSTQNIFDKMEGCENTKNKKDELNEVKASMLVGGVGGTTCVNFNGAESIFCYEKVQDYNLYVISVVDSTQIVTDAQSVIVKVFSLIVTVVSVSALIGIVYYIADKRYNNAIRDLVYKDELTGHISYAKFLIEAEEILKTNPDKKFAIYYGDVKNFKYINDTFGYDVGDKFIIYISDTIKKSIGDDGIFARINADSYAILRSYDNREDFIDKIYNALDKFSEFSDFKKENFKVGVYVGVYCKDVTDKDASFSEMLDKANMAQKSIKGSHEFHLAFYNEEIRERIIAEKEIEKKMEAALANDEFVVFYQPKYDVRSGEIIGAEALVRWNSPERGLLLPGKFIPLFEQNGFIVNLDQYVFETVCKTVREWLDNGKKVVSISINVSRVQFYRLDFVKRYTKIKNKYEIPDGLLELEFTESIVLENIELLQKIVNNLKANGFLCSIDDFGSGYSSLNILKNLPMDILKLDRLFFKNSENTERDKALIASVVAMARALKMKTVSEGIETWNQVNFLKEIGCDVVQGYVYSEPISRNRFEHLVEGKKKKVPEPIVEDRSLEVVTVEDENLDAKSKYLAALNFLRSTAIEIDYDTDSFKIVKGGIIGSYDFVETEGTNATEVFTQAIDKLVHPDDVSSIRERCLPIGVLSSFYQGEKKIITDFKMLKDNLTDYMWCRATIVRVEHNLAVGFRSILFLENIDEIMSVKGSIASIGEFEELLYEMFSMIFEVDYNSDEFTLLYYDKEIVGDRPEKGEFSWFREQYLKDSAHPDDLVAFQNFLSPLSVLEEFKNGKKKLLTKVRLYVNDEVKYQPIAVTLVKVSNNDEELKVFAFCQSIEEIYESNQKMGEMVEFVNNAICDHYDLVYLVDLYTDEIAVVNARHAYSSIPRNIKYSKLISKFVKSMVDKEDREKVKDFMDPVAISTALKLGKSGDSHQFKRKETRNGEEIYHSVRVTYMRVPPTSNRILFLARDLGEIKQLQVSSGADADPLRHLYKNETTDLLISRALESIDVRKTIAFILLDISDVKSLSDDDRWTFDTKEGVLEEFHARLRTLLSSTETVYRTGGYEFVILSDKAQSDDELQNRAEELCGILREPFIVDGNGYKITGNIGVSIYGIDGTSYERLYMNADVALFKARFEKDDIYSIYNGDEN